MWRHVDLVRTDVSEERITSIFRVEKSVSEEPATFSRWFLAHWFFYPEDGGDVPPKRRFAQDLHDTTSQKTALCTDLEYGDNSLRRWIYDYFM
jgi:hypothetical protein